MTVHGPVVADMIFSQSGSRFATVPRDSLSPSARLEAR